MVAARSTQVSFQRTGFKLGVHKLQGGTKPGVVFLRRRKQSAARYQHAGRKPLLDGGKHRRIGPAQAEAIVGNLFGVDIFTRLEIIHCSHQVLGPANHELHLGA